ncbi:MULTISPECIES: tripartite tricarboxylate transporter TctB family protein [unclassified Cytobacillus]|uniref:tripartite tricarboxylate transporter TctB family protein n=1 Tax=unclassified Cytobacillus TaxID=2675268 RepID=UPI00203E8A66|nr:tripartite tricarboxylate transporter TctB family protein [Cytobacillus sp. AMY 15.2]MCM3093024.1 tripartite tricarboxylate transporter TctB family protein [Cytobacillus sp. AMY 15.2]
MRINKDYLLAGIVFAIGLFFVIGSYDFPPGEHFLNSSRSFPTLLGYSLIGLSIWQLIQTIRKNKEEEGETGSASILEVKRGILYLLFTVVYIFLLIPFIGFLFSTLIFLLIGMLYYKEVRWYTATLVSIGMIGFIYVVFEKLMYIRLP